MFIKEISRIIPVIRVNYETFRTTEVMSRGFSLFRESMTCLALRMQEMAAAIATQYEKMTNIRLVEWTTSPAVEGPIAPSSGTIVEPVPSSSTSSIPSVPST